LNWRWQFELAAQIEPMAAYRTDSGILNRRRQQIKQTVAN